MTVTTERVIQTEVVSKDYEARYRPADSRYDSFWEGSEEDRTFFTLLDGSVGFRLLVVKDDDDRGKGMRAPSATDVEMLRAVGLNPEEHRVWTVEDRYLEPVSLPEHYRITGDSMPSGFAPTGIDALDIYPTVRPASSKGLVLAVAVEGEGVSRFGWEVNNRTRDETNIPASLDGKRAMWIDDPKPSVEVTYSKEAYELLNSEVNRMREELQQARTATNAARQAHESDIEIISDRLISEANQREWCEDYDNIVYSLNSSLNVPLRDREHEITVVMDVTMRVTRTIMARNDDDAYDKFKDDVSEFDDIRYDGPEIRDFELIEAESN